MLAAAEKAAQLRAAGVHRKEIARRLDLNVRTIARLVHVHAASPQEKPQADAA
jgi:DNA-binding CsgD family transcriptional regulator